jgi:hypothetical protein
MPPVSHFILNQVDGDLTRAIGYAVELRERQDVKALRDCFAGLEEARRKNPARLARMLKEFERMVDESVARWGPGPSNRVIMALSRPEAMVGTLVARFGARFVYRYASFYKSLVDAIAYHNYGHPHLHIEMRHDYEESEAQAIGEMAAQADPRPERARHRRRQMNRANREPRGIIRFPKRSDYGRKRLINQTVRKIVDTFGGWGS